MLRARLGFVVVAMATAVACGQQAPEQAPLGADAASYPASAPVGPCGAVTQQHAIEGFIHVDVCSYVQYGTLPPSSGDHYPYWAAYMTYDQPVPEGYWVHNLEHGSIVLSYNCGEAGCAEDIAAAQQMMDQFPVDPVCTQLAEGVQHRLLMTPDPRLDVRFAASAWDGPSAPTASTRPRSSPSRTPTTRRAASRYATRAKTSSAPRRIPPGCGAPP